MKKENMIRKQTKVYSVWLKERQIKGPFTDY